MPQVDGLELLRRIKQSAKHKDLPVILCSGHADPETMKRAAENGCALYLLKPVEPEFLLEQISTVVSCLLSLGKRICQQPSPHPADFALL